MVKELKIVKDDCITIAAAAILMSIQFSVIIDNYEELS